MSEQEADLPLAHLMRQIEENAPKINELASQLTTQIEAFEDWFNDLPGRVETHWEGPHDAQDWQMQLRFHRSGKRWRISFDYYHPAFDTGDSEWKPLTDGSIETKLEAITTFPKLLTKMLDAQRNLKKRLAEAQDTLHALTAQLDAARKEGG